MQKNVEANKIGAARAQKFGGRIIRECAQTTAIDLLYFRNQVVDEIFDCPGTAPANDVRRDFVRHADRKHRRVPGDRLGSAAHCFPRIGAILCRIQKADLPVPRNINEHL